MTADPGAVREDGRVNVDSQPHLVEIVAALKEITASITSAPALPEAVDDLVKATASILPPGVACAVTVISEGEPAAHTGGAVAVEIFDETRHAGGEGPALEAIRTRGIIASPDLTVEPRWQRWTAQALDRGVRAVLAYPFDVDGLTLGALTLYSPIAHAIERDVAVLAMLVADHASLLLRSRGRASNPVGPDGVSVQRAVGIVMAQRGCPPDQALRHLHEAATQLGVGLDVIAQRLVHTVADRGVASDRDALTERAPAGGPAT
jgi:GAF domain/ANTAR domain